MANSFQWSIAPPLVSELIPSCRMKRKRNLIFQDTEFYLFADACVKNHCWNTGGTTWMEMRFGAVGMHGGDSIKIEIILRS